MVSSRAHGRMHRITRRLLRGRLLEQLEQRLFLSVNVLTWHNDLARDGWNPNETMLTPANVNQSTFGKLFSYPVDGQTYAQPLYASNLNMGALGTHDVVFAATEHNSIYAFDADSNAGPTGGLLWHVNLGPSSPMPNSDFGNRYGPYHDIDPEVGITSTPVIDPSTNTMYVDAFTHDGPGQYSHHIHALDITTGAEKFGGPVIVQASVPGSGAATVGGIINFTAQQELQRPALTLLNGIIYVMYSGYADTDPYHGWVLGFNAANLHLISAFNTTPNGNEGGIWQTGNGLSSDGTGLYVMTGNGTFDETLTTSGFPGSNDYGDSFLRFTVGSSTLTVSDYFTPSNESSLSNADEDLGSGGTIVLPDSVGSAAHPHLLVGAGKEGKIYLLDRDNMGKFSPSTDHVVQELPSAVGGTWSNPAYANGVIYYHGNGDVLKAFTISNGVINPVPVRSGIPFPGDAGGTPSVSSNGTANGIVWEIQRGSTEILRAYDASNVATELYDSNQNAPRDALMPFPTTSIPTSQKFMTPTIADGHVFVGTNDQLAVFGLMAIPTMPPNAPTNLTAAPQSASQVKLTWVDNSNNESAFKIQRSPDGITFTTVGTASVNATTFTDNNLTPSTQYFYRVVATNVVGDSGPSNVVSATTAASTTPVDWYKFDEGSGTGAVDSIGNNNGTLVGSPAPQWIAGRVGPDALSFSGDGGFGSTASESAVNVAHDLSPVLGGTASLTAWVRTTQVGNNTSWQAPGITGVEQTGAGNDIRWGYLDGSGHIGLQAGDGASIVSTVPINDGQWHHIAMTRDAASGQVNLYIDGALNVSGTSDVGLKTSRFFTIGATTIVANDSVTRTGATYFNGSLDDVRIYNSILGASEIASLGKVPAAPTNLTGGVASDTVIQLSWTNVSSFATGVKIERKTGASGTYALIGQVGAGINTFADNNVTPGAQYFYRVRATDAAGDSPYSNEANVTAVRPTIANLLIFYNRSVFDGMNGSSNVADARAIATDKHPLLPGHIASFTNYTSYLKGINGIMIDVANFAATPSAADFTFKIGNNNNPSTWADAPAPWAVNVYPGQGTSGTNRITILWEDGSIKNTWLQVTMLADAVTGLAAPAVFYWGNAVGDTGNSTTDANVDAADELLTRNNSHGFLNAVGVTNPYDFNRDGKVDAADQLIARNNAVSGAAALQLINLSTGAAGAAAGPVVDSSAYERLKHALVRPRKRL